MAARAARALALLSLAGAGAGAQLRAPFNVTVYLMIEAPVLRAISAQTTSFVYDGRLRWAGRTTR